MWTCCSPTARWSNRRPAAWCTSRRPEGQNIGDELNAAGLSWGWFQGGQRPTISYEQALTATGRAGQPTSTFIPDEFKNAGFQSSVPHSSNQGLCDAVHPVGVALGGSGQYGYKDDYIAHHEPFDYYASTANPHHLTISDASARTHAQGLPRSGSTRSPTPAACRSSTRPTTTTT
jgi:hypothetical protein